jgi:hypothetical protein
MPNQTKASVPPTAARPANSFVETARELGLDNQKSADAFERAMRMIIPPKTGAPASCETAKPAPCNKSNKS